ncbi:MAG: ABC transporter permease [Dehalococcoidia bacterium]|nr:ABC transporter permease [Dehalococcoidia bacterium]MCA9853020.1 ABC transporter permease [Dehalococcoidia bacterium]
MTVATEALTYDLPQRPTGIRAFGKSCTQFMAQKRLGAVGLIIVVFWVLIAFIAALVPGAVPKLVDEDRVFDAPNPDYKANPTIPELAKNPDIGSPVIVARYEDPTGEHWFGTDNAGRDIYSRTIYGARLSLTVGFGASVIAVGLGMVIGVTSGFYRGWIDLIFQRFVDALQAFPALVLLLLLVQIAEPSVRNTVLAMGFIGIPIATRLVRSAVFATAATDYVMAARAMGATDMRVMMRHVLPNIAAVLLVAFSIGIGAYILFEATISFLGVGPRGVVSWGKMVADGRANIDVHPWLSVFAGAALASLVVGFNFLGDALRDVLDPRLRGSR